MVLGKLDPEFPHELPGFAFAMKPLTELEVFFQNSSLFPEAWWPGFLSFQQEQGLAEDPGISDGAPGHRNARYCSAGVKMSPDPMNLKAG